MVDSAARFAVEGERWQNHFDPDARCDTGEVKSGMVEVRASLLLEGFRLPAGDFPLAEGLHLRHCADREVSALLRADRLALMSFESLSTLEWHVVLSGDMTDLARIGSLRGELETAALALRLTFPGTVGWRVICYSQTPEGAVPILPAEQRLNPNAFCEGDARVSLEGLGEAARLLARVRAVSSSSAWPRLVIALKRFTDSYARRAQEDKAVDLAVCLEALAGEPAERKKKELVATRVAPLIAAERGSLTTTEAHQAVLQLYNARSAVVHGSGDALNFGHVLEWKDMVRACLRQYLLLTASGMAPAWTRQRDEAAS